MVTITEKEREALIGVALSRNQLNFSCFLVSKLTAASERQQQQHNNSRRLEDLGFEFCGLQ